MVIMGKRIVKRWLSRTVTEQLADGSEIQHGLSVVTVITEPSKPSEFTEISIEPFEQESEAVEFTDRAILIDRSAPSPKLTLL